MNNNLVLHPDRLFPADVSERTIARRLFSLVEKLPILSPHGHTDPRWFAENKNFSNATELLIKPDHYIFRMLYSQGIPLENLGITAGAEQGSVDPREVWRIFAKNYKLFRGTPSLLWLNYVFFNVFNLDISLSEYTADLYYDHINKCLQQDEFRPRHLFDKFNIELLATTESPIDSLEYHQAILQSDWDGRVITAFRPDPVVDPEFEGFQDNLTKLEELTGENTRDLSGYLNALSSRREYFKTMGATSTDHGHPSALTADLSISEFSRLFNNIITGRYSAEDAEVFRAQMLTEMARMSMEDGLVMQLHPGSFRNHNQHIYQRFGRDKGADIPVSTSYVEALRPLLNLFGNEANFSLIVFTLDESTYSRELAPLAGHYPALKLGPAWWFHDSPEGMRRYREHVTETAGFYNTVGFNDDTRAFLSIPARHDLARRMDCAYLARLVAEHRISEDDATETAIDLAYNLVKKAYKL